MLIEMRVIGPNEHYCISYNVLPDTFTEYNVSEATGLILKFEVIASAGTVILVNK
jgi:hypothetical protein